MADSYTLGIDCGGTKVMAQSVTYNSITGLVSPGEFQLEVNYSDSPKWNSKFIPVHLDLQRQEFSEGFIYLTQPEMDQGNVIVETIQNIISKSESDSIGLCFPGIKNERGVVIMANGPRIPDFLERIQGIDSIPHDSDCCVLGEWKSTIGKLQNCDNAVYIGGGTGIADGIIESCLSPKGMIDQWNVSQRERVETLDQLSKNQNADTIFEKATEAFSFLIQNRTQFFKANHAKIEKIVIGQRLGIFMANSKLISLLESNTDIPLDYSTDRRTAALGAAWKRICS